MVAVQQIAPRNTDRDLPLHSKMASEGNSKVVLGQYGRSKKCQLRGTTDDEQEYIVSLWPTSLDPTETVFAVVTDGSTEARRWAVEARKVRDSEDHATDLEAFKTKVENARERFSEAFTDLLSTFTGSP